MTLLRPRYWAGHLTMVVCVGVALVLGLWQLDAWQTRREDAARDLTNAPPVPLTSLMDGDSPFPGRDLGRPVSFDGKWLADSTFFVADRYLDGRKGHWAVVPVVVDGGTSAVPVVLGWSAEPGTVRPSGEVQVTGWLQATEGSGPLDEDPADNLIPTMRLASLVEHVDVDLYSAYVVASNIVTRVPVGSNQGANGVEDLVTIGPAEIPEVSGFTALRNFLYAVEWWVFGAFALFVWVRWCRDSLEVPAADEPEPEG